MSSLRLRTRLTTLWAARLKPLPLHRGGRELPVLHQHVDDAAVLSWAPTASVGRVLTDQRGPGLREQSVSPRVCLPGPEGAAFSKTSSLGCSWKRPPGAAYLGLLGPEASSLYETLILIIEVTYVGDPHPAGRGEQARVGVASTKSPEERRESESRHMPASAHWPQSPCTGQA